MNASKCFFLTAALTALPLGSVCEAQTVTPQACEQSIVNLKAQGRFLWLPIEDKAPEGKVQVIVNGALQMEQNVRIAREGVDYYVGIDLQPYQQGGVAKVCVQNVPKGSIGLSKIVQNDDVNYELKEEAYRPTYHHTPVRGWMNDPNGMFYQDGIWHLYYQYNPYGSLWGNMHWGHSTSTDLIHWQHQPVALAPDVWGTMFSGSCIVDHQNTTGFGKGAVVAMYTASRPTPFGGDVQAQCLAYSLDGGMTFTKYEGNPVLMAEDKDFRDPNMFWNEDIKAWNLILAVGQEMRLYSSPDLKNWTEESRFGSGLGGHGGVWECPDLMKVQVEGSKESKWVLLCNINPGGPFGGSATQYFVGDFDGHTFTVDDVARYQDGKALWMDYGKDHYATVSWSNAPEGRRTVIAWMSNWEYANDVPTRQFRSANSIARDVFLYRVGKECYLGSRPAKEYDGKGLDETYKVKGSTTIHLTNEAGDDFVITYDQKTMTLTCDRTKCGDTSFSQSFPAVTVAPVHRKLTSLRVFIDECSVEVFGNNGEVVLTNLVFPKSKLK